MSKRIFSKTEQQILAKNPNVKKVSAKAITYHPEFKVTAVKAYLEHKGPTQIFLEAGFDLKLIGTRRPKTCLQRWRKTHLVFGEKGLLREARGKGSPSRPRKKALTDKEKLLKFEAKVKYLEAELDFLKKLDELERRVK